MSYFDTDVLHERIAELQQELLEKHSKVHEALRLRDLANGRIVELEKIISLDVKLKELEVKKRIAGNKKQWEQAKGGAE